MATREVLFTDELSKGGYFASISCSLEIESAGGRADLVSDFVCRSPEGEDRFSIKHQSTISNPIDLAIIVGALTTKYAVCVAGSFLGNTAKEIYHAYGDTKEEIKEKIKEKKPTLIERVNIFGRKIKGKTKNIKAHALGAFAGCSAVAFVLP